MPRPTTLPEPWASLAAKLGGVRQLADALICDARTLHRWAHGDTKPDRRARDVIQHVFRHYGVQAPY